MAPPSILTETEMFKFKLGAMCFKQESLKHQQHHYEIDSDLYQTIDIRWPYTFSTFDEQSEHAKGRWQ